MAGCTRKAGANKQIADKPEISPLDGRRAALYDWMVGFPENYASLPVVLLASAVCRRDLWLDGVFRARIGMGPLSSGGQGRAGAGLVRGAVVGLWKGGILGHEFSFGNVAGGASGS